MSSHTVRILSRLHGVIGFIKPSGITSTELCNAIRDDLALKLNLDSCIKIGHGGTLDKPAHGVLPVGFGDGCKFLTGLLTSNKKYRVEGELGTATDTYNAEGTVVLAAPYDHVKLDMLNTELEQCHGDIQQKPPVYSALKLHGQRLADIARAGGKVPETKLLPRKVTVRSIKCLHFSPPRFLLEIECGGGFYVRSLVHDLGERLGSYAHAVDIQRTQHGPFTLENSLQTFQYDGTEFLYKLSAETNRLVPEFQIQNLLLRKSNHVKKNSKYWINKKRERYKN